jgi:PAS domain S-box-containing protein
MQTFHKRFSVITGFGLLVIVLAANAIITRRQLGVQVENQRWLSHTRQVLFELAQTESLLKDAETGQRGFLYTGDPKYLAPYNLALGQVGPSIEKLTQLTADNPRQQASIAALRNLVQSKSSELAQTISLYQSGNPGQAKALVLSDAGLVTMNHIRKLIDEMGQEETSLEGIRSADYQKSIRVTTACIYLASFIAALGLVFLAYYILHEMELRERHARQILEREEWFRVTLTSLGDAVIATDEQGRVTFLNPLAEQLTGRSLAHSTGRPIQEVFPIFNESTHHVVENPVKKVMELGRIVGLANHTVLQNADGSLIPIEDSAAPIRDADHKLIGVVLVFRDATLERKSQEVLRKTEKLAAAARLAATVAHEINNPLEAIGNLIYITKGIPGLPAEAAEQLALAEHEVDRISHITRQTLGFYRESSVPGRVEIPALVDSVLNIYSNKFKTKNITIQREFGDCPPIRGLAGELKQAVSNLISNAADAVSDNGTIRVKLECIETSDGQLVQVWIEDDGPGIGAEHRDRIFEPFFTTKKDVGTGLGLWVTKEIIDRHGGSIEVRSRENKHSSGAIFSVLLPSAASGASTLPKSLDAQS